MTFLLDTNAVIALLKDEPAVFRKRLRRAVAKGAAISVSSIVLYELWYGVAAARAAARMPSGCACSCQAALRSAPLPRRTP